MDTIDFATTSDYDRSFSRNLGILTHEEQKRLASATVLIVGTGGIGGNCAAILARMGVGNFHLVDSDTFELANINRQFGAKVSTQGKYKVDVIADEIADINPSARLKKWLEKFSNENADEILDGVDICIDAIDFYRISDHLVLHRAARAHERYVLMGSPVGFSACLQIFDPKGMSLMDYCGITEKMDPIEMQLRYACGLVPGLAHLDYYDVSKEGSNTDFLKGEGPSLASACTLAAAFVAGEIVMILLGRRNPRVIPHTLQHDPYTHRNEAIYIEGGMPNYDPTDVLEGIKDKSSLVVNIFDTFYRKVRAATLPLRDGGSLCYRVEGKGKPIVFLSPVGTDTSFWARQIPAFSSRAQVITLDNRGIGRSSELPQGATIADMAEDVIELITHLNLKDVALVGCALGSLVAMQVAMLRPDVVAALSLIASYEIADDVILKTTADWRATAQHAGMDAVFDQSLTWLFSEDYQRSRRDELYKLKTFYRVNQQHPGEFCKQTIAANQFQPVCSPAELRCPVQFIHGRRDKLVSASHAEALHRKVAASEIELLENGGHFLNWELSEPFNGLLGRFLQRVGHWS